MARRFLRSPASSIEAAVALRSPQPRDRADRRSRRCSELVDDVGEFGVLRRAVGVDDRPERRRLRRRRLGVEGREVERGQISGDVADAAVGVPAPEVAPVRVGEIFLLGVAPRDVMPAVVGWQVDAVGLVVGRDDDAADVERRSARAGSSRRRAARLAAPRCRSSCGRRT